jgi:peptide/nickel transport system substrate-binding protein
MAISLSLRRAFAAALPALALSFSAAASAETVLRTVPSSDLKILDPIWTTANITRNHGS